MHIEFGIWHQRLFREGPVPGVKGMSKPVSFSPVNRPARTLSVAISTRSSSAFSTAVQRDFITFLSGVINIKTDLISFQKN